MLKQLLGSCVMVCSMVTLSVSAQTTTDLTDQPVINRAIQYNLNPTVAKLALHAFQKAEAEGKSHSSILTIIDYSLPSSKKRMWVFDLKRQQLLFNNVVTHADRSGNVVARSFSNRSGSHKTSLGLYLVKNAYYGRYGYAARMKGLERGINDNAMRRAIVMHGAWFANPSTILRYGHLGRSWGCPSIPQRLARPIINTIKNGSLLFVYGKDRYFLRHSHYIA